MRIKKYEGATTTEALRKVKRELGPEAVILNVRSPATSSEPVEVTAALDEGCEERPLVSRPGPKTQRSTEEPSSILEEIQEIKEFIRSYAEDHRYAKLPKELHRLAVALREGGVEPPIVDGLVRWLLVELKGDGFEHRGSIGKKTQEILQRTARVSGGIRIRADRPTVVCLVGPTGSGKTTTAAKIAAEFAFSRKAAVSLVTVDTKRVAAVYQLRCYSEALGLPLRTVYSPEQVRDAVRSDAADASQSEQLIVVDTAGVNPWNQGELDELGAWLSPMDPDEVYLVLSATTGFKNSVETIAALEFLPVTGLLFTKIDEISTLGTMLSIVIETHIPGCYLTTGRSVPGNIELADAEKLAEWALRRYA